MYSTCIHIIINILCIHIHSIHTVNKAVTRTQQLSPGLQKKTSNLTIGGVYSAPNSPHAGTKTGIYNYM